MTSRETDAQECDATEEEKSTNAGTKKALKPSQLITSKKPNSMEKMNFSTNINAPKEKVWTTLWSDETYRKWTSVFSPTSYADTDWKEGSKVLFLDGQVSGMVSKIEVNRPNEFMSFLHLGEVKDGVEDTESDKVKGWAGAHENYTLKEVDGGTELLVELDVNEEFKDYMVKTFPKAMEQVKELCESNP